MAEQPAHHHLVEEEEEEEEEVPGRNIRRVNLRCDLRGSPMEVNLRYRHRGEIAEAKEVGKSCRV